MQVRLVRLHPAGRKKIIFYGTWPSIYNYLRKGKVKQDGRIWVEATLKPATFGNTPHG